MKARVSQSVFEVEVTDTFGGDANYCWVRRYELVGPEGMTRRQIVTRAKAIAGYTNCRGTSNDFGDMIEWRPRGICHVMFITFKESREVQS